MQRCEDLHLDYIGCIKDEHLCIFRFRIYRRNKSRTYVQVDDTRRSISRTCFSGECDRSSAGIASLYFAGVCLQWPAVGRSDLSHIIPTMYGVMAWDAMDSGQWCADCEWLGGNDDLNKQRKQECHSPRVDLFKSVNHSGLLKYLRQQMNKFLHLSLSRVV